MHAVRANLLFILSMAMFALEDFFIKRLTGSVPPGQVLLVLGLGGSLFFALPALRTRDNLFPPVRPHITLYLRTLGEGFCAIFIVLSLSKVPLATFATTFQAVPLVVTVGAALFLREQVGWRRWLAIVIGFAGVLLIIRPGASGFEGGSLLVLAAVVAISMRDIVSRRLPAHIPTRVVAFQGFFSLVLAGPVLSLSLGHRLVMPVPTDWMFLAATITVGVIGYRSMVIAMRIGEVSALAPFRYTRMVFALVLGIALLGERPDLLTYAGAALIIVTGLYTYVREQRLARKVAPRSTSETA
ncbi:MAG: DMT family transporter [Thalassovita sp.]|nr:DMT family transporter [Thalassovita sp.]